MPLVATQSAFDGKIRRLVLWLVGLAFAAGAIGSFIGTKIASA
jgi:hypothetical protein